MMFILWLIAVILVISGIYVLLARRDLLWGIVLIVVGLLVGPGGVSIFT
ncbi:MULTISPECIES: GPGG-motif small membrane protein [Actinomadura]|uniref:GPGG-motif small membrane protein n=1 Tax=Actinomadura yumaensis TaxID=111807 RepID=A0ABW2CYX3_9ACTN|nr:GPGG-motif small membrane protein [Actinomadura sp. J1-007]